MTTNSPAGVGCHILIAANGGGPDDGYLFGAPFFRKFAPSFDVGSNEFALIAKTGSFDCPKAGGSGSGKC